MERLIQTLFLVWAGVSTLQADIIYTPLDPPLVMWTSGPTVLEPLDFNGDGTPELTLGAEVGFFGVRAEGTARYAIYESPPPNIGGPIEPLPLGYEIGQDVGPYPITWFDDEIVGPGAPFAPFVICLDTGCSGRFRGQLAYMGVEFELPDGIHYGWVSLSVSETVASGSVGGFAYESQPGMPIIAGAIPEPSTLLLFVAGAMGVILCRMKAVKS